MKKRKAVGTANKKEDVMLVSFPSHGYFVVDSVVAATRADWKNRAIAWSYSHGHACDSAEYFSTRNEDSGDFIVLDADGQVV